MIDLVVIGGGTAGLTAAIYAGRAGLNTVVIEESVYGGQIAYSAEVENFPAIKKTEGWEFATKLYEQAEALGAQLKYETVVSVDLSGKAKKVVTNKETYETKTIIIANGVKRRKLGMSDEDRLMGRGVAYCATCDGAMYRGKTVAVVGGGNTAVEDSLYLAGLCEKVYLIYRGNKLKAEERLTKQLVNYDNIEIIYEAVIDKIEGESKVEKLNITKKDGFALELNVDGLFIAIGFIPSNEMFKDFINLDENGYIDADETCRTNVGGVYAAGDTRNKKLRQLVTAAADGAVAATAAQDYVREY